MIGMLALAAAAASGPVTQGYFPTELTEPRMLCDAMRPDERTSTLSLHDAERYSAFLAAAGEPVLAPGEGKVSGEVLRFTWLRTFDSPIIVRVERHGKSAHLVATMLSGQAGYAVGAVADRVERELAPDEVARLRAAIAGSDVAQLPPKQCERQTERENAVWLVERADRKDYDFVLRKSGEEAPLRDLGQTMLDLAGWGAQQDY